MPAVKAEPVDQTTEQYWQLIRQDHDFAVRMTAAAEYELDVTRIARAHHERAEQLAKVVQEAVEKWLDANPHMRPKDDRS